MFSKTLFILKGQSPWITKITDCLQGPGWARCKCFKYKLKVVIGSLLFFRTKRNIFEGDRNSKLKIIWVKKTKHTIHLKRSTTPLQETLLCRATTGMEAPTDTDGQTWCRASLYWRCKAARVSLAFQRLYRRTVLLKMGGVSFFSPFNRISLSLHYVFKWRADVRAAAAAAAASNTGHILMTGKLELKRSTPTFISSRMCNKARGGGETHTKPLTKLFFFASILFSRQTWGDTIVNTLQVHSEVGAKCGGDAHLISSTAGWLCAREPVDYNTSSTAQTCPLHCLIPFVALYCANLELILLSTVSPYFIIVISKKGVLPFYNIVTIHFSFYMY